MEPVQVGLYISGGWGGSELSDQLLDPDVPTLASQDKLKVSPKGLPFVISYIGNLYAKAWRSPALLHEPGQIHKYPAVDGVSSWPNPQHVKICNCESRVMFQKPPPATRTRGYRARVLPFDPQPVVFFVSRCESLALPGVPGVPDGQEQGPTQQGSFRPTLHFGP